MTKLFIMCGLAFSGKSTLAEKIAERAGCKIIAFDKLWIETEKTRPIPEGAEGWRFVRDLAQAQILDALKSGSSVVYDDNNAKKEHREELRNVAKKAGVESAVIYLDTSLNIIKLREETNKILQNRHDVEPKNFNKVLQDFELPTPDENVLVYKPKDNLEEFINRIV